MMADIIMFVHFGPENILSVPARFFLVSSNVTITVTLYKVLCSDTKMTLNSKSLGRAERNFLWKGGQLLEGLEVGGSRADPTMNYRYTLREQRLIVNRVKRK